MNMIYDNFNLITLETLIFIIKIIYIYNLTIITSEKKKLIFGEQNSEVKKL